MAYTRLQVMFPNGAENSASTITSGPVLTPDFTRMTLSVYTGSAGASAVTVQASNENGITAAINAASWSNVTTLTAQGEYTIDPGPRWVRALANKSDTTVVFHGKYER